MKYFIENKEGEWLKNPDEVMGPGQPNCWTRDPDKAWGFTEEDIPWPKEHDVRDVNPWSSNLVRWFLIGEDLAPDTKITEHEFIEIFPMHYKDINEDFWMKVPGGDMYKVLSNSDTDMKEMREDFKRDLLGF